MNVLFATTITVAFAGAVRTAEAEEVAAPFRVSFDDPERALAARASMRDPQFLSVAGPSEASPQAYTAERPAALRLPKAKRVGAELFGPEERDAAEPFAEPELLQDRDFERLSLSSRSLRLKAHWSARILSLSYEHHLPHGFPHVPSGRRAFIQIVYVPPLPRV